MKHSYLAILFVCAVAMVVAGQEKTAMSADQTLRSNARINPSTLGMELSIALGSYPGRAGMGVPVALNYSSKVWRMQWVGSIPKNSVHCIHLNEPTFAEMSAAGWTSFSVPFVEYTGKDNIYQQYGSPSNPFGAGAGCASEQDTATMEYVQRITIHMPDGSTHELRASDTPIGFSGSGSTNPVNQPDWNATYYAVDGSNLKYEENSAADLYRLYEPDGTRIDFNNTWESLQSDFAERTIRNGLTITDRNGNQLTYHDADTTHPNGYITDTLGRPIELPVGTEAPTIAQNETHSLPGGLSYTLKWKALGDTLTNSTDVLCYRSDFEPGPTQPPSEACRLFTTPYDPSTAYVSVVTSGPFDPIVLSEIELANGSSYKFGYDIYGKITKIEYPTGASEVFDYSVIQSLIPKTDPSPENFGVTHRSLTESTGTTPIEWTYSVVTDLTTNPVTYKVVTNEPDLTHTERYLTPGASWFFGFGPVLAGYPFDERAYNANGALVSKKLTTYSAEFSGNWFPRVTQVESITYDPAAGTWLSASSTTDYGPLNNISDPLLPISTTEYGFTTNLGSLGTALKTTETDYLSDSNYTDQNLRSLPTEIRIKDGNSAGPVKAKTHFTYDECNYDLSSSGTMPTLAAGSWTDPATQCGSTAGRKRGQVTSIQSYYDLSNSLFIETHSFYDQFGNVRKVRDGSGNDTETLYDYRYAFAYPTSVTTAAPGNTGHGSTTGLTTSMTYDYDTGHPTTTTDANNQTTTIEYVDPLLRPTKTTAPNGRQTITEYGAGTTDDTRWVKIKTQIDETNWKAAYNWFDGLGRARATQSVDTGGDVFSRTCYHPTTGKLLKVSNPIRSVSIPSCSAESIEWTENTPDPAGRPWKVITPDGAVVKTEYGLVTTGSEIGTAVTVTDQAGKLRRSVTNALGQLIRVDEPDDSSSTGSLGDISAPNQKTTYDYDTLNNLTHVYQGSQTRTFVYDSLSRLTSAANPESGTINYTYDANGNLYTKTDARSITTTYTYDALNRVTHRDYSDTTPDVDYYYDTIANAKGKLIKVASSVSTTEYTSFDIQGRVTGAKQTTDSGDPAGYSTSYTYTLGGALDEETYPSGRVVKNVLDSSGELATVKSKKVLASPYVNYASNFTYNAAGAVTSMELGNLNWEKTVFNSRLQPTQIALGKTVGATDLLKLDFSYGDWVSGSIDSTKNNGNIVQQVITVPTVGTNTGFTATQKYYYDSLNRLDDANEVIGSTTTWRQDFTYDRYGNRNFNHTNTSMPSSFANPAISDPTISTSNNQITSAGYTFDAAGNTVRDAVDRKFTYDAENKQTKVENLSAGTNTVVGDPIGEYSYDGDARRVKKIAGSETTIFVYDAAGKQIAEYSTTVINSTDAKVNYLTNDHLGSPRINTDRDGQVIARHDYHPFGEEISNSQRLTHSEYFGDSVRKQFTGFERDEETELDFAQARSYNKKLGRFTTPDQGFADQNEENPQSWNLYLFVRNNPLNFVDPSGSKADCPAGKVCILDENGKVISEEDDKDPVVIDTTAPQCSPNNPCRTELPDSWNDWIPVWGSFRQTIWNMRCRESGGCNIDKALYNFGKTSLELTPFGWAMRGAKAVQPASSILKTLCFEKGTMVRTEDGLKPIEEIKVGDKVLSYNEKSKHTEYKIVLQTFKRFAKTGSLLSVKVEGETEAVGVTSEHPFYVRTHRSQNNRFEDEADGKWVGAKDLQIRDEIRTARGTWVKVESVSIQTNGAKVYNLDVADNHNYFVGQTSMLAHNQCDKILQTGGHILRRATVDALIKAFEEQTGRTVSRETIKAALEALKRDELGSVANATHGAIKANGDVLTQAGETVGNIFQYIP